MKYLIYFIGLFLSTYSVAQDNLILNPNFEQGTLPVGYGSLPNHATHWDHGCGPASEYVSVQMTPDLFDINIPNGGPLCKFDVPFNYYFGNLFGNVGNRYAAFEAYPSNLDGTTGGFRESILGKLSTPLDQSCYYKFKIHIANREHKYPQNPQPIGLCDDSHVPYVIQPNKTIDIVLRKDDDCDLGLTVLTFTLDDNTSWTAYEGTFALSLTDLAVGYNRIEIKRGDVSDQIMIACDALSLEVDNETTDLDPSFTGPTQFCTGDDFTFTGDDGPGTAQYTFWEIQETNQYGAPVSGGYNWNSWFPGEPGTFTFPEEVNPPCNKYYWIKMAVNNPCTAWEETLQIIHVGCNPKVPKPKKYVICRGDCIALAGMAVQYVNYDYQWYSNGSEIPNNGNLALVVCPDEYTEYLLVVTDNATGCSATSFFTVNLETNDPSWSHYENTTVSPYYYNITAVANNTDTEDIPGFDYSWLVERLNNDMEPMCDVESASCWMTHPLPTDFRSYNGSCVAGCSSSQSGRFYYDRYYRITRTTWSNACSPLRQTKIFYSEDPRSTDQPPRVIVYEVENSDSASRAGSQMAEASFGKSQNSFSIFPNPNTGEEFQIHLGPNTFNSENLEMKITNLSGQIVHCQFVKSEQDLKINLTDQLPSGVYIVSMASEEKQMTRKLIIQ